MKKNYWVASLLLLGTLSSAYAQQSPDLDGGSDIGKGVTIASNHVGSNALCDFRMVNGEQMGRSYVFSEKSENAIGYAPNDLKIRVGFNQGSNTITGLSLEKNSVLRAGTWSSEPFGTKKMTFSDGKMLIKCQITDQTDFTSI